MDIDQLKARFPDEKACRDFWNPLFGDTGGTVSIAIAKRPTLYQGKVRGFLGNISDFLINRRLTRTTADG